MSIDIAYSSSEERPAINHTQDLIVACDSRLRQVLQIVDDGLALPQMSKRDFTQNVGMAENLTVVKQCCECWISFMQVINPDRGIGEDQ